MLFVKIGNRSVNLAMIREIVYDGEDSALLLTDDIEAGKRVSYRVAGEQFRTLEKVLRHRNAFIDLALPFSPGEGH